MWGFVGWKRDTVKVVIFAGGNFAKCWQDISREGNFHDTTPISFIKAYGFYFCVGVIFAKIDKSAKRENYPHAKNSTFTALGLI